jgi:hypothetical protein
MVWSCAQHCAEVELCGVCASCVSLESVVQGGAAKQAPSGDANAAPKPGAAPSASQATTMAAVAAALAPPKNKQSASEPSAGSVPPPTPAAVPETGKPSAESVKAGAVTPAGDDGGTDPAVKTLVANAFAAVIGSNGGIAVAPAGGASALAKPLPDGPEDAAKTDAAALVDEEEETGKVKEGSDGLTDKQAESEQVEKVAGEPETEADIAEGAKEESADLDTGAVDDKTAEVEKGRAAVLGLGSAEGQRLAPNPARSAQFFFTRSKSMGDMFWSIMYVFGNCTHLQSVCDISCGAFYL